MKKLLICLALGIIVGGSILAFSESCLVWPCREAATPWSKNVNAAEQSVVHTLARALAQQDTAATIWPGYDLALYPLIVTFDSGHIYAFNLKAQHPQWEQRLIHGQTVLFSAVDYWGLQRVQMQNDFSVDGQPSFVFHLDLIQDNLTAPLRALFHERFRLHQNQAFKATAVMTPAYSDRLNVLNTAWMQMEEMILADFMNAQLDTERSNFHKASHLRDFLAVQQLRQQLMSTSSMTWEWEQQRLAGVADYVALKSLEQLGTDGPAFNGVEYLLAALQASSVNEEVLEHTTKWRHYAIGATLGYTLDFLEVPAWKERVERDGLSPVQLLAEVIDFSSDEIMPRIEKIKSRYAFEGVLQQVTATIEEYQEEIADLMQEYALMEGVEVYLAKPAAGSKHEGGSSLYKYYLKDGSILSLADTSVHRAVEDKWSMRTFGAPMVMKKCDGSLFFKLENEAQLSIDGQLYTLAELGIEAHTYAFTTLVLKGRHCELQSRELPGQVQIQPGRLTITYQPVQPSSLPSPS